MAANLKGTKREPEFEVGEVVVAAGEEPIVPFDDNRRIRRIIVPGDLLRLAD